MIDTQKEFQNRASVLKERVGDYLRAGQIVEARDFLNETLTTIPHGDIDFRLQIKNNLGIVERRAGRLYDAIRLQTEAEFLTSLTSNHLLIGNNKHGLGITWQMIAECEGIEEYNDRALLAYDEACENYQRAGAIRELSSTKNCIAYLFIQLDKLDEALKYADAAIQTARPLGDDALIAQFGHTRAQAFFKSGNLDQALMIASHAAAVLRARKYWAALAEVLETIEKITAAIREETERAGSHN